MSTNSLPCAVCGKTGQQYCLNLANTAAYCSRECHGKAAETREYGYDHHRMNDPEYRAFAEKSAVAASKERIAEYVAKARLPHDRLADREPGSQPEHPAGDEHHDDPQGR